MKLQIFLTYFRCIAILKNWDQNPKSWLGYTESNQKSSTLYFGFNEALFQCQIQQNVDLYVCLTKYRVLGQFVKTSTSGISEILNAFSL